MSNTSPEISNLIESVGTVAVPPTATTFVACEHFVIGTSAEIEVRIGFLGKNFTDRFLHGTGKVEEAFAGSTLCFGNLLKGSVDDPIIEALGGKAESTLTELFFLMERQGKAQLGILSVDAHTNIFYVKDTNRMLCSVGIRWTGSGWDVLANFTERPHEWRAGSRVFFRN